MPQKTARPISGIPEFYRLSVDDRVRVIHERGMLPSVAQRHSAVEVQIG